MHIVEHVHPMIRTEHQVEAVCREVQETPGIVLYTLVNQDLCNFLENKCSKLAVPCISVLEPVLDIFNSYLGVPSTTKIGAQHELDANYFRRIDALNFTLMHDDGILPDNFEDADIIIVGISRTSKTPTSIFLANRGLKTVNIPIIRNMEIPAPIFEIQKPLVVALYATPERIVHIRQNRILALNSGDSLSDYVDRKSVAEEISYTRNLCKTYGWPMIDVTRKSIEEIAAEIYSLYQKKKQSMHQEINKQI